MQVRSAVQFAIKIHVSMRRFQKVSQSADLHCAELCLEVCGFHVWINQVQLLEKDWA